MKTEKGEVVFAELPLHPGLPVFRSLYFLGVYTLPLIHLQSPRGRTMNESLMIVLKLLFLYSAQLLLSMAPKLQPEETCLTSPSPTLKVQLLCLYQYYSSAISSFCTLSDLCYRS